MLADSREIVFAMIVVVMLTMVAICAGAGNGDAYIGDNYDTLKVFPNGWKVRAPHLTISNLADTKPGYCSLFPPCIVGDWWSRDHGSCCW